MTPSGEIVQGFSITIGGITDPSTIQRRYDDIKEILRQNSDSIKVSEERYPNGRFKKFVVET